MSILKIMLIDMRRCRMQLLLMLFFLLIAIFMASSGTGIAYLTFAAIILATQPFLYEQRSEAGFICMLPSTLQERVAGRYLFGMFLMFLMLVESFLMNGILLLTEHETIEYFLPQIGIYWGIGMIIIAFQYILFYALGKIKRQQLTGILVMLPGFAFFILASLLPEYINTMDILQWMITNLHTIAKILPAVAIVLWGIAIGISIQIAKKKDFV